MPFNFNVPKVIVEVQQTVSGSALSLADFTGITADNVTASARLWLVVNTNAVRLFYGGATPTTSLGIKISAGSDLLLTGSDNLANFKIIRDGASDSEVAVVLEG
jgi:hypothetical protein